VRELEPLPDSMKDLAVDERGYPVPFFVDYLDGKPEFRAMDQAKFRRCLKERLCWVCGQKLGVHLAFTVGPMCGLNRTSSEPPSHYSCAAWSARNCPFLSNPRMVRREDDLLNNEVLRDASPGFAIARNPGVTLLWVTRQYEIIPDPKGRPLIQMGEPERAEWWCEGRTATRAEVDESIASGLPNLEALARQERGGMEALTRYRQRLEKWLP
jgi:hypothetical protein